MKTKLLLLVCVITAGLALRVYNLSSLPNGLHWDEADTGYQAYSLLKTGRDYFGNPLPLFLHSFADFRTPVYIYSAITPVAVLGLSPESVRLTSVIWGTLGIIISFILAHHYFGKTRLTLIAPLVLALSIWHVQYSRQAVETISFNTCFLLGLALFHRGLKKPCYLILSSLLFGLSIAAYSPAKLFVPAMLLVLVGIYFKRLRQIATKYTLTACLVLFVISGPILFGSLWGSGGSRFHNVSIFTDPTVATEINYSRLTQALSSGIPREIGLRPRLIDKIAYNKPLVWVSTIAANYLRTFSTEFLFIKGDPEPRHSPSQSSIGQVEAAGVLALILGFYFLSRRDFIPKNKALELFSWIILAPVPAALTRDGGTHAARLLILLPALVLIITAGAYYLRKFKPTLLVAYLGIFLFSSLLTFTYYFANYRWESAKPFQWGFSGLVKIAAEKSSQYDRVILDMNNDSALMAYLFTSKFEPQVFQSQHLYKRVKLASDILSYQFGNIYVLEPHTGFSSSQFSSGKLSGKSLVITTSDRNFLDPSKALTNIKYPDDLPAFSIFELQ